MFTWVDVARAEIIEKYHPGEHDKDTYLLKAAHINVHEYFCQRVHEDIDKIMWDIKETHKNDSTSAPKNTVAEELKRDFGGSGELQRQSGRETLVDFLQADQTKIQ